MAIKILIVEDDPTMLTLLQTFLQFEGFEVAIHNQLQAMDEVMRKIRSEKPDVVIMDVYMGELNGFDLLAGIRSDPEIKDVSIIMSSGADFNGRSLAEGANSFILKPYMPEELVRSIYRVVAG
jgi:DNA-binding response OmpR family regulator